MLVNLGYYYDRDSNTATWLSDTWEMDMEAPPYAWKKLNAGISQEDARQVQSEGDRVGHPAVGREEQDCRLSNSLRFDMS